MIGLEGLGGLAWLKCVVRGGLSSFTRPFQAEFSLTLPLDQNVAPRSFSKTLTAVLAAALPALTLELVSETASPELNVFSYMSCLGHSVPSYKENSD